MHLSVSVAVYVGLPVGVGWHVPLVGIEGRGGYKPSAEEQTAENEKRSKGQMRTSMHTSQSRTCTHRCCAEWYTYTYVSAYLCE